MKYNRIWKWMQAIFDRFFKIYVLPIRLCKTPEFGFPFFYKLTLYLQLSLYCFILYSMCVLCMLFAFMLSYQPLCAFYIFSLLPFFVLLFPLHLALCNLYNILLIPILITDDFLNILLKWKSYFTNFFYKDCKKLQSKIGLQFGYVVIK